MPSSLQRVNGASKLLEEACAMLKADPYSQSARKKLIEGARGARLPLLLRVKADDALLTLVHCLLNHPSTN